MTTISRAAVDRVRHALWSPDRPGYVKVWALVDGTRGPAVHKLVDASYREKTCLLAGEVREPLRRAAPWLLLLEDNDWLTRELIAQGWGRRWGVFVRSDRPMRELRAHLAHFLQVRDEHNKRLLFRYWDPRFLGPYLQGCETPDLTRWFADVFDFIAEGDDGRMLHRYGFDGKALVAASMAVHSTDGAGALPRLANRPRELGGRAPLRLRKRPPLVITRRRLDELWALTAPLPT